MKPSIVLGSAILAFSLLAAGPAFEQQTTPPDQPAPPDQQAQPDQPAQQTQPDQPPEQEPQPAQPDQQPRAKKTSCTMRFDLKGWSAIYKTASGSGKITCDNGEKADVKLSAKGGGLTAGKYVIKGGRGKFSAVASIRELFGRYATAGTTMTTGMPVSADLQVVSKGKVTLGLAGASLGVNAGVSVGELTIRQTDG